MAKENSTSKLEPCERGRAAKYMVAPTGIWQPGLYRLVAPETERVVRFGWRSMVGLARFELATNGLGNRCSIHLSYSPTLTL